MLVIRFGKWSHKATSMFTYTRIFRNGCEWTPFCIKKFRYVNYCDREQYQKGYEDGFNDAMLSKQELMYKGVDGKWHMKDW